MTIEEKINPVNGATVNEAGHTVTTGLKKRSIP